MKKQNSNVRDIRSAPTPLGDLNAEAELIGGVIQDPGVAAQAIEIGLRPEHFEAPGNAAIYKAAAKHLHLHGSVGVYSVAAILQDDGELERVGGIDHLKRLAGEATPSYAMAVGRRLLELAKRRSCAKLGAEIQAGARGGTSADEVISNTLNRMANIDSVSINESDVREAVAIRSKWIQDVREGRAEDTSINTGFYDIDRIIDGIQRGSLIPLAAFTSVGKTAFALDFARKMKLQGRNGIYFSLEPTISELSARIVTRESDVDYKKILHPGRLNDDEFRRIQEAKKAIDRDKTKLQIVYDPNMSTKDVRMKIAMAFHAGDPYDFAIVDYLQLMKPSGNKRYHSREQEVSAVGIDLKKTAEDFDNIMLALCQTNDEVTARKTPVITISDVRESKAINKHADIFFLLYYSSWEEAVLPVSIMTVNVAKNNTGAVGKCELQYDKIHQKFNNYTKEEVPSWVTDD